MTSAPLCSRCVLPSTFPGIRFDERGLCNHCTRAEAAPAPDPAGIRRTVEALIREKLGRGPAYDLVLAFSGGKDSTFVLKYLRETFQARILAVTIDNGFLSGTAHENCREIPARLGVDHVFCKPAPELLGEIYGRSLSESLHPPPALKRNSAICNSCIQVINAQVINFALKHRVPMIAGGYLAGQVPSETGFMKQNLRVSRRTRSAFLEGLQGKLSLEAIRLFEIQAETQDEMAPDELSVINPMLYLNVPEETVVAELSALGWRKPSDTGRMSTNCRLNDFAISRHLKAHSFHPYAFELATLVRKGLMKRDIALEKLSSDFSSARDARFDEIENLLQRYAPGSAP